MDWIFAVDGLPDDEAMEEDEEDEFDKAS